MHGESGKYLRHSRRIEAHVLEGGRKCHRGVLEAHVLTHLLQCFEEHQQTVLRRVLQRLVELVGVYSDSGGKLMVLVGKVHDYLLNGGRRHLDLLTVGVKDGAEGEDLRDGETGLRADTGHTLCELNEVRLGCRTVLRQHIDSRADGKHGILRAEHFLDTEDVCQLGDSLCGSGAQIDKRHIDDVGGLDIALNAFESILTQSSGFLGEFIQLLSRCSGVHVLESVVEPEHVILAHTRVLSGICQLLVHLGEGVYGLTRRHNKPRNGSTDAENGRLAVVEPDVHSVPHRALGCHCSVDALQLSLNRLDFGNVLVPCGGTPLYAVELLLQCLQGTVQFPGTCLVKAAQDGIDRRGRAFELVHDALSRFKFTLKLLHRGLVSGLGCLGNLLLQTACVLFERREHVLRLFAVDGEDYIGCTGIVCHRNI